MTSSREPGPGPRFRRAGHDPRAPGDGRALRFTDLAMEQLRAWPALDVSQTGHGAAIRARGLDASLARLCHPDAAELCLTWPVIQRLHDALAAGGQVTIDPGSDWIRLPLQGTSDVRLLLSLISVAIHAQAARADTDRKTS